MPSLLERGHGGDSRGCCGGQYPGPTSCSSQSVVWQRGHATTCLSPPASCPLVPLASWAVPSAHGLSTWQDCTHPFRRCWAAPPFQKGPIPSPVLPHLCTPATVLAALCLPCAWPGAAGGRGLVLFTPAPWAWRRPGSDAEWSPGSGG